MIKNIFNNLFDPWHVAKEEDYNKHTLYWLVKGFKYDWWKSIIKGNIRLILFVSQVIISTITMMMVIYKLDYIPILSVLIIIISLGQFSTSNILSEYYENKSNNRLEIFKNLCNKLIEKNYITEREYYSFYIKVRTTK
jgi:hypothetical protein